jgi:hypothetical protein
MKPKLIKQNQQPAPKRAKKRAALARRGGPAVDPYLTLTGQPKPPVNPRAEFEALFRRNTQ